MNMEELKKECKKYGWKEVETKVSHMWSCKNLKWRMNVYLTTGTITIQPLIGYGTKTFRDGDFVKILKEYQ